MTREKKTDWRFCSIRSLLLVAIRTQCPRARLTMELAMRGPWRTTSATRPCLIYVEIQVRFSLFERVFVRPPLVKNCSASSFSFTCTFLPLSLFLFLRHFFSSVARQKGANQLNRSKI